jgi:ParB-like chromosome segregation protein Spo0J
MTEERIGNYRVHPVASMFPLLEGEEFEKFRDSIKSQGQQQPIIVQGDTLIDGRNRLRACLELELDPIVEEYRSTLPAGRYILVSNIRRRHLLADQRISISSKAIRWIAAEAAERRKHAGKSADGVAGGRGRKNLTPKSGQGLERHERSTAGQIADSAKSTRYKAEQMMRVEDHAPELADKVAKGEMSLRDADKMAQERKPRNPAPPPKAKPLKVNNDRKNFSIDGVRIGFALARDAAFGRCPDPQKKELAYELMIEFMPVIDLLFPSDRILLSNRSDGFKRVQVFMDNLTVERLAQLLTKAFTPEQRAALRGLKW